MTPQTLSYLFQLIVTVTVLAFIISISSSKSADDLRLWSISDSTCANRRQLSINTYSTSIIEPSLGPNTCALFAGLSTIQHHSLEEMPSKTAAAADGLPCDSRNPDIDIPRVRFLVYCPRSGSTMIMRIFGEHEDCAVTSRLVFMGNRNGKGDLPADSTCQPDYSIFTAPQSHPVVLEASAAGKTFLVNKDELGHDLTKLECDYALFPAPIAQYYSAVKPAFLFRDPVRVFDSWKALGWTDMNLSNFAWRVSIACVMLVKLEIKVLCEWWSVPFKEETMLSFQKAFGEGFLFQSERERRTYCEVPPKGLFDTVAAHPQVVADIKSHGLLSGDEIESVEEAMGRQYLKRWGASVTEFSDVLQKKTWFAFDLDDTLHEFRKASGSALQAVLAKIHKDHGASVDKMETYYRAILAERTPSAFTDGRTSRDYRKERFEALLNKLELQASGDDGYLDNLADIYQAALSDALTLKSGVLSLLTTLKAKGKKIAIVTEGPEDAQIWTIQQLGIAHLVDYVATTNKFHISKVEGLLGKVLQELNVERHETVFIGDNWARDIEPAIAEGVFAVHYSEGENVDLSIEGGKGLVRVNTPFKVKFLVEGL